MAECSFVRCVQERRAIKKELQRWTKNMVFVVGLERVAEELMGRRKWKKYQELTCQVSPLESSPHETKDWEPQDKCCLCDENTFLNRALSPSSEQGSSSNDSIFCDSPTNNSSPLTPPLEKPPNMTTFESVKLAAIAALSSHTPETPPSLTANMFYPPNHSGLFAPWYLPPLPPHLGGRPINSMGDDLRIEPFEKPAPVNGGEQPLDLSAKAPSRSPTLLPPSPQSLRVPTMDNKHIYKAKPRMSAVAGRRTYTEDELQAALRDIQSGKLGTRRAAVIYGIPRSTLRNKVYKLAMERERDAQLLLAAPVHAPDDEDKELSAAEEEREVEKALRKPLLSMEDLVRFSVLESGGLANPEALRHLLQQRKLDGSFPVAQGNAWGGFEHAELGPYISQLLAAGKNREAFESGESSPKFPPSSLPDLVRRMMAGEEPPRSGSNGDGGEGSLTFRRKEDEGSDVEATPANVILKIPSFKPTSKGASPSISEPFPSPTQESSSQPFEGDSRSPPGLLGKGIGVSLRDVIAKSISQKFQQGGEMGHVALTQKLLSSTDVEPPYKRNRFSPPLPTLVKHNNNNNHLDDRNLMKMSSKPSMNTSNSGGKGTRPKRGKYRNYDRDSLVEAVRAVQRGEMSVHRAGSYYGVPHSTLEYKVKERHLMRPRKRDPKPPPTDEPKRKEEIRLPLQDKSKLVPPKMMKPPYPTSPLQTPSNGMKIPPMFDPAMSPLAYSTPPPFPFWPPNPFHSLPMPEFPRGPNAHEHFLASQMMQRLQEESSRVPGVPVQSPPIPLGKNAREMAESLYDGTGTNGTFLDGIIRSSLEMGLSKEAQRERTPPENLSNKALLDQLCRNSRLTPPTRGVSPPTDEDNLVAGSPSSDDSGPRERTESKDRSSPDDSRSKDFGEDFSENEGQEADDESACDSKNILQNPVENAAKDIVKVEVEEIEDTEKSTTESVTVKSDVET